MPADAPYGLTRRDFMLKYAKGTRLCRIAAGFGYLSVFFTLTLTFISRSMLALFNFIDIFLYLTLILFIHIGKSRAAAVLLLIYSIFSAVYVYLTKGTVSGLLTIPTGILAVIGTVRCAKEWKDYIETYY